MTKYFIKRKDPKVTGWQSIGRNTFSGFSISFGHLLRINCLKLLSHFQSSVMFPHKFNPWDIQQYIYMLHQLKNEIIASSNEHCVCASYIVIKLVCQIESLYRHIIVMSPKRMKFNDFVSKILYQFFSPKKSTVRNCIPVAKRIIWIKMMSHAIHHVVIQPHQQQTVNHRT